MHSSYYSDDRLFQKQDLARYLAMRSEAIEKEINGFSPRQLDQVEDDFVNTLVDKYTLKTPSLDEGRANVSPREENINPYPNEHEHDSEPVLVRGLAITVTIPFEGRGDLFEWTPSRRSLSGSPSAKIEGGNVILYYETTEKNPEVIKQFWAKDIATLKEHLSWVADDVSHYNDSLRTKIIAALSRRKKEAEDNQSLINSLKM